MSGRLLERFLSGRRRPECRLAARLAGSGLSDGGQRGAARRQADTENLATRVRGLRDLPLVITQSHSFQYYSLAELGASVSESPSEDLLSKMWNLDTA